MSDCAVCTKCRSPKLAWSETAYLVGDPSKVDHQMEVRMNILKAATLVAAISLGSYGATSAQAANIVETAASVGTFKKRYWPQPRPPDLPTPYRRPRT